MNETKIVIVDGDADYCRRLDGVLREKLPFPVSVRDFTDIEAFSAYKDREDTAALLISETSARSVSLSGFASVIVLSEGLGLNISGENIKSVNKFRRLSALVSDITEAVMRSPSFVPSIPEKTGAGARLIGFFTPLTRCLQSTAALTLGQLLSDKGETLYLSFEPFSGIPSALFDSPDGGDLAELIYYFDCEPKKLNIHAKRLRAKIGKLGVIAPADTYSELMEIEGQKWREFFAAMRTETDCSYIICDLSVCVQGLFELMTDFDRVITIERDDPISREKLFRWERLIKRTGHEDILEITRRISFPAFSRLPADPARYGEGPLAEFISERLKALELRGDLNGDA